MNRDSEKTARKESGAGPAVHDLRDRVPQMTDDALTQLQTNALRLKESGTALQKGAVVDLLPVVEAELARRRAEKIANAPPKASRAKKKTPPKPDPEPEAESESEAEEE